MKRVLASAATIGFVMVTTTGVVAAMDMTVEPATVPAEGETTFDITLDGFEPDTVLFVLPCDVPEGEVTSIDDIDAATCATTSVTSVVTDAGGTATVSATWTVPAAGLAIVAGDEARTMSAVAVVAIDEASVLGTAQENPEEQVAEEPVAEATTAGPAELADTGSETVVLLLLGTGLVATGTGAQFLARRRSAAA